MVGTEDLARAFEAQRGPLRALAYRLLGSAAEADDAVQEAWLRLGRVDAGGLGNPAAWLRTVVSRIALDMLRARAARREEPIDEAPPTFASLRADAGDPEQEVLLADQLGIAMGVVLGTLAPAERVAFVLHDMFELPFDAIAPIVDKSPEATRQLASRARRQLRRPVHPPPDLARQAAVVAAYLAASRRGDLDGLLAVLDPDVTLRTDRFVSPTGREREIRGAAVVAKNALAGSKHGGRVGPALLDGRVGFVVAPGGRLRVALLVDVADGRVTGIEAIADPARLRALEVAVLPG